MTYYFILRKNMAVPKRKVSRSKSRIRLFSKAEVAITAMDVGMPQMRNLASKRYPNKLGRFNVLNKKKFQFKTFHSSHLFFRSQTMATAFFRRGILSSMEEQ